MNAHEIQELLRKRFCPPAYAFLPQVRSATGSSYSIRTADAIVMGLWPSRGMELQGFEIKVAKSDWKKELANPEKAEEISRFCDYWWISTPKGLCDPNDLPENWGLMEAFGDGMKVIKQPKQLTPVHVDRRFLAAILRQAQETLTPEAKIKEAYDTGRSKGVEETKSQNEYFSKQHKELQKKVADFEKASGVRVDTWRGDNVGEAVRMVLDGEHLRIKQSLQGMLERSKGITEAIEKELAK